jgi:antitoxin component YwqK of YwqJK toxin-antitoxin module
MKALICLFSVFLSFSLFAQGDINKIDANGLKQGTWEKKFENGQVRYRGQFVDDKPVGTFFYYYEEGGKSYEVAYESESDVSHAKFFHKNGVVMSEGDYFKRQKQGVWKFYDGKTVLSMVETYEAGILNGTQIVYYLNGKPSSKTPYVNGLKNGPFVEYFSNGKIKTEGTFLDDNYDQEFKQYYSDGTIYAEGQYRAAVKDGQWVYYAEDGQIMVQELWEHGKMKKRVRAEGYEEQFSPMELDPEKVLDENTIMEQYFNEMNGTGGDGQ